MWDSNALALNSHNKADLFLRRLGFGLENPGLKSETWAT
jgi:hypothetical protein